MSVLLPLFVQIIMFKSAKSLGFVTVLTFAALTCLAGEAKAETFTIGGKSLNTNNGFRRIDGQPRLSIYTQTVGDPDQDFQRLPGNKGGVLLKHKSTGKCLNAHYLANGREINVWNCDANDPDQNWNVNSLGGNVVQIKRAGTNLCIDTPTRNDVGVVHLWACDSNNTNQRWQSNVVSPPSLKPPLLSQQNPAYFNARLGFYGRAGNIFAASRFGSRFVDNGGLTDGNCTWYAHGRVKELGGNVAALNSMRSNANRWHTQLSNGSRILNRGETPQFGDIAQWGSNHVAVVERVYTENGVLMLTISESHYPVPDKGIRSRLHQVKNIRADSPTRFIRVPGI
ncbi:MAG: CHAP domain-containing protein [Synechococcales cyanobacterium RM1_1_8]|nr:CHAP domain-containing protein [Synechococcales cyanobacterium RM1_1_8]